MADDTKTLNLAIKADIEVARAQLDNLVGILGKTATDVDARISDIEAKISGAGNLISGFVGGLAAGLVESLPEAGHKLLEASERALEYANTIKEVSERTNVSTDFLQTFRFAALNVGASVEVADKSLDHFNKVLGDAQGGNQRALAAFRAIPGVTREMVNSWTNSEQAIRGVSEGFNRIGEEAQKSAVEQRLFGEGSAALIPMLEEGAKGFDKYAEAARGLGMVLGPEQIENAHKAEIQFDRIKTVLDNQFASAVTANADALLSLGSGFIYAGEAAGNAIARINGARAMMERPGGLVDLLFSTGDERLAMATPQGQYKKDTSNVARLQRQLAYQQSDGFHPFQIAQTKSDLALAEDNLDSSRTALINQGSFGANYIENLGAKDGNSAIHERAAAVIERLKAQMEAGGDKRQAYINSQLLAGGLAIGDTSDDAKTIIAAAGKVYDDGPGKTAAAAEARSAEAARLAAAKRIEAGTREVSTAERQARDAEAAATFDPAARYAAQVQNLDDTRSDRLSTIDAEGPNGTRKLTASMQADERSAVEKKYLADKALMAAREADRLSDDALSLQTADIEGQKTVLQDKLALADTSGARRTLELQLLELADQEQRLQLEELIAKKETTAAEREKARMALATLNATHADRVAATERGTEGPLAAYLRTLPDTAGKIDESVQKMEAGALSQLDNDLTNSIVHFQSLGDVASHFFDNVIAGIVRIGVEKEVVGPLGDWLFGSGKSGAGQGVLGTALHSLLGFADGGDPPVGVPYWVGERGPELRIDRGPGTIIPNGKIGLGSAPNINVSVDARGSADPAAVQRQVVAGIFAAAPAIVAASKGETITDIKRPRLPGGFA